MGLDATILPPGSFGYSWVLADDFVCTNTGPITGIVLWGSWLNDSVDVDATYTLSIWSDVPWHPGSFSHPGELLWTQVYTNGQYTRCLYTNIFEVFYDVLRNPMGASTELYQLCFQADATNTFTQTGTLTSPTNYWLSVAVQSTAGLDSYFGWTTSAGTHYATSVASGTGALYPGPGDWFAVLDYQANDVNLAFDVISCPLPVIQCSDRIIQCGDTWDFIVPQVVDQCCSDIGKVTMAGDPVTNSPNCPQIITANWQYTDCHGRTVTCIQTIYVVPVLRPSENHLNHTFTVEWSGGVLLEGPSIGGPWNVVLSATPPTLTVPETNATWFYRLHPKTLAQVPGVLVPAGTFNRGDVLDGLRDAPMYPVYVSAFYMDKYLVTGSLWSTVKQYADANGYHFLFAAAYKAPGHPVHTLRWWEAVKWCNARSELDELTPVYYLDAAFTTVYKTDLGLPPINEVYAKPGATGWRLPTEAEWEKAARGGLDGKRFPLGDAIINFPPANGGWANYYGDTTLLSPGGFPYDLGPNGFNAAFADGTMPYTSPVGAFPANGYGLCDMAGNVAEWCWDWYSSTYYAPGQTDPQGPPAAPDNEGTKVYRGGAWELSADWARCAARPEVTYSPGLQADWLGFRCVRMP
jgi:formylglycine-generating enzyme required for sulfatase activity